MKRNVTLFLLAIMLVMAFAMPVSAATFRDVPGNAWYYSYVNDLSNRGILNGYTDGTFRPGNNITRAEITKILAYMSGEDTRGCDGYSTFRDCNGHWADEYINWAAIRGIVSGVGNENFQPNAPITREALCTMVLRYAKYKSFYPDKIRNATKFADGADISNWAGDAVYHLQRAGIISGKGNNIFDPKGYATRAECAKIFCVFRNCNNDTNALAKMKLFNNCRNYFGSVSSYYLGEYNHDSYEDLLIVEPLSYGAAIHIYTVSDGTLKRLYYDEVYPIADCEYYYLYQDSQGAWILYYNHDVATGQVEQSVLLFYGTDPEYILCAYNSQSHFYIDGSASDVGIPKGYTQDKEFFQFFQSRSTFLFGSIQSNIGYNGQSYERALGNWAN